jgi:ATP-dependent DNA ligase
VSGRWCLCIAAAPSSPTLRAPLHNRLARRSRQREPTRALELCGRGVDLFRAVCERDCEGIVAKWPPSPYRVLGNLTPWLKIRNPHYTQSVGRHEFFSAAR